MISDTIQSEVQDLLALGRKTLEANGDTRALDAKIAELAGLVRDYDMLSIEELREVGAVLDALPPRAGTEA